MFWVFSSWFSHVLVFFLVLTCFRIFSWFSHVLVFFLLLGPHMFSWFFLAHMQWFIFCVHEPLLMRRHSQTPQMWNIRQNVSTGQEGNAAEIRSEYDFSLNKLLIRKWRLFDNLKGLDITYYQKTIQLFWLFCWGVGIVAKLRPFSELSSRLQWSWCWWYWWCSRCWWWDWWSWCWWWRRWSWRALHQQHLQYWENLNFLAWD